MAVYGGEPYIAEAIESIRRQSFADWELLLINDCTKDASVEVIESFDDSRIRLIHNTTNQGLVSVRNRIVVESRGEFIAWLDQDDLAAPNRLTTQVNFLDSNPHVSACGSTTKILVHENDGSTTETISILPKRHRDIRAELPFLNPMACNTVTMRKQNFIDAGLTFRSEFGNSLDYDLWSRASDQLLLRNLSTPLGAYRIHPGQTSQGDALATMKDHALRVQVEIIERALGLTMSEECRDLHRSATIAPVSVSDPDRMRDVAQWFALLRRSNNSAHAFDRQAFDEALARQWMTVVLAAQRILGRSSSARLGWNGARAIGIGVVPTTRSTFRGMRRRSAAGTSGSARNT